jgi:voltage-gated potassium channel
VSDPGPRPSRREALREEVGPSYELFIVGISTLSIVNIVIFLGPFNPATKEIAGIVDLLLSAILILDFLGRLWLADPWQDYFFRRRGYLDLLGSLPLPVIRIFRIARVYRGINRVSEMGGRKLARQLIHERAQAALLAASFLVLLVLEVGSMLVVVAEHDAPGANITTGGDALWWAVVTIATVGYGDKYPVTAAGRLIGVVMIVVGVGLFGIFTGYLARAFLTPRAEDAPDRASSIPPSALPAAQDPEAQD